MKRISVFHIVSGMAALVIALLATKSLIFSSEPVKAEAIFEGRDFIRVPFALVDAFQVCHYNAKKENSNRLLRSHMDELSTTYNRLEKNYLIVINADIGSINEYSEAKIYCSINASNYEVAYYKEVFDEKRTLLNRGLGLLTSFFSS